MSEKAQEVRRRRLESMEYLRKSAEIAFDFILNEIDEKTSKEDYSPVSLFVLYGGLPRTSLEVNHGKSCNGVNIGIHYHDFFLEILEKMFNTEEGYTAAFIHGEDKVSHLIVNVDVV